LGPEKHYLVFPQRRLCTSTLFLVGNLHGPAPKWVKTIAYLYFTDPKHPLRRFLKTKTGSFLAPFF
jgi:hypothetical protein